MIVGVAMGSAAPLISKTMKNSQVGNFQIMRLNRDLDSIRKDITNIKNNYVTKSALTATLKKYVTNDALTKMLERYVTNDNLTSKLADYAKTSDLPDLTNYATNRDIANFLTANDLGGYATAAQIEALSQQISALQTQLNNIPGLPGGIVAHFYSDSCPPGWMNVTRLGWGGYFFRVADDSNPNQTAQEQSIQEHWHDLPNFWGGDKSASGSRHSGGLWLNSAGYDDKGSRAYAGSVHRGGTYVGADPYSNGERVDQSNSSAAPYVSSANETRPKNIPLVTCYIPNN